MGEVENAIIKKAILKRCKNCFLEVALDLEFDGYPQGFGHGLTLYLSEGARRHEKKSIAGHVIWKILEVGGVEKWSDLEGKIVRVKRENSATVEAVGHAVYDKWIERKDFFCEAEEG